MTTDALAQSRVNDDYRGRVFAFYDVVVNFGIVCGALMAAVLLPASGIAKSLPILFSSDNLDSVLICIAILGYLSSALFMNRFTEREIGPMEYEISAATVKVNEIKAGFVALHEHNDIIRAIVTVALQRSSLTALTLMALLLERNTFNDPNLPDTGLTSFGFALAIAGIGVGVGAVIAPYGVSKFGRHRFIRIMLLLCVLALCNFAVSINEINLIVSAFFLGLFGQAIKVTTDAFYVWWDSIIYAR